MAHLGMTSAQDSHTSAPNAGLGKIHIDILEPSKLSKLEIPAFPNFSPSPHDAHNLNVRTMTR